MPRGVELSSDVKGQIIGMSNSNKSARQISRELNIPHSTISYAIERFRKTGSNNNLPRSGRPSLLTERNMNMLGRTIKKNRFTPLKEVINQLPITVNVRTARNALKERDINLYTAAKKPNITATNIKKRKDWCKEVINWTDDEWKKVIWSNESSVELGLSSRKIMVFCSQGQHYQPDCLLPNHRSGCISVMFWGCFWQNKLGPLVAISKGSVDLIKYCEILETHLFPFYMAVRGVLGHELWFMDDNAMVHKSAETRIFKEGLGI